MNDQPPALIESLQWATPYQEQPAVVSWPLLAFAAALLLSWAYLHWRKRHIRAHTAPPLVPPYEVALKGLRSLDSLLKEESCREFVIAVSHIVRVCIQDTFGLRARNLSTEEFLRDAARSGLLSAEQQELLAGFLRQCDLVKFAQRHVLLDQMNGLLQSAYQFVEGTASAAYTTTTPAPQPREAKK
jgi:hypothetical protein